EGRGLFRRRGRAVEREAEVDLLYVAFVPGRARGVAVAAGELQEAALSGQARGGSGAGGLDQTLRLLPPAIVVPPALAPAARRHHAELPAHLVLGRRGAIGIERVALEQHGVRHLADVVEHQRLPPGGMTTARARRSAKNASIRRQTASPAG